MPLSPLSKLRQLKTTLHEKTDVDVLQQLDKEILDVMTGEDDFAEEIELADECPEKLQLPLIDLETALVSEGTRTRTILSISRRTSRWQLNYTCSSTWINNTFWSRYC